MTKAIIFDCFGVLVDTIYEKFKPKISEDVYAKISEVSRLTDHGNISSVEGEMRITHILSDVGLDGVHELSEIWAASRRRYDLLNYILFLRKAYKTGLLSNTGDFIYQVISKTEIEQHFDDAVLSYQVHMLKPDKDIYNLAAKRLGVEPNECIFVDDRQVNIDGAGAVGMQGILYKDFVQFKLELNSLLEGKVA